MIPIYYNKSNNSPKFTARCPQIRDSQWVCHAVNSTLPHFSTTRFFPMFNKVLKKTFPNRYKKKPLPKDIIIFYNKLESIDFVNKDLNKYPFTKRVVLKIVRVLQSKTKMHNLEILAKCKEKIAFIGNIRKLLDNKAYPEILKTLIMLQKYKVGNCLESATTAELILKVNGIKNGKTAILFHGTNNRNLDHAVCVFNRDGSLFDGQITKNTIIIDPWIGKADFAHNMFAHYKNMFKAHLNITDNTQIRLEPSERVFLNAEEIKILKTKYPNFIFKSKTRKFMQ